MCLVIHKIYFPSLATDFVDLSSSEEKKIRMFSPSYQVSLVEVALQQQQCESAHDKDWIDIELDFSSTGVRIQFIFFHS